MQQLTLQQKRKQKMFFLLPVIFIPLLTLLFWSQGGGQGIDDRHLVASAEGLNTSLPKADLKKQDNNKLTLYQLAIKDSQQMADKRREDPYATISGSDLRVASFEGTTEGQGFGSLSEPSYTANSTSGLDENEARINKRLAELNRQLAASEKQGSIGYAYPNSIQYPENSNHEMPLPQGLSVPDSDQHINQSDPELDKMNAMLEKIYDIQHPEAVKEKLQALSEENKGLVYALEKPEDGIVAGTLGVGNHEAGTARTASFYGLEEHPTTFTSDNKAFRAVISETQTLVSGATVKLRLKESVLINGVTVPKGSFLFGSCQLAGERLQIDIRDIHYQDIILPVSLSVYDLDGIEGVHVPGTITRDAVKEGMDQGIQGMNILSMDPSIGAQAAAAGVQATKSLFSRKARLIKCTIKAGYPVLLVDTKKESENT